METLYGMSATWFWSLLAALAVATLVIYVCWNHPRTFWLVELIGLVAAGFTIGLIAFNTTETNNSPGRTGYYVVSWVLLGLYAVFSVVTIYWSWRLAQKADIADMVAAARKKRSRPPAKKRTRPAPCHYIVYMDHPAGNRPVTLDKP